jgi:hypothetical protein
MTKYKMTFNVPAELTEQFTDCLADISDLLNPDPKGPRGTKQKMVLLDKAACLCLVKGTGGPGRYEYANTRYGSLTGFPNEKWEWNNKYLESLNEIQLCNLYMEIKTVKEQS